MTYKLAIWRALSMDAQERIWRRFLRRPEHIFRCDANCLCHVVGANFDLIVPRPVA